MRKDNSGPAFPLPADTAMLAAITPSTGAPGMTMRQYYAGQALIGILARGEIQPASAVVETSWRIADDMIAEGDK